MDKYIIVREPMTDRRHIPTVIHESEIEAKEEAVRLAKQMTGNIFNVFRLQFLGMAEAEVTLKVKWTDYVGTNKRENKPTKRTSRTSRSKTR